MLLNKYSRIHSSFKMSWSFAHCSYDDYNMIVYSSTYKDRTYKITFLMRSCSPYNSRFRKKIALQHFIKNEKFLRNITPMCLGRGTTLPTFNVK